ncbi:DoxX family protein [Chitinophaga sp.]|uniref:DoxX family protein n=1 Tax=Chitinophaga sp. TaxID=1869181 RepID=UPI002B733022|nr:DoxX family protein [Chitinophaga sp.]HWV68696.1 DoxX family protein [Chitinophaga sp.]
MTIKQDISQLFLRVGLGASYLCAGLDRFGVWGPPGAPDVSWGDWQHFMQYAYKLMFFLPYSVAEIFAAIASGAEITFGILLIAGFWTRWAAIGSGLLLLGFALAMTVALGITAPLNYSVFTASAGSFLLSTLPAYRWSIDGIRKRA